MDGWTVRIRYVDFDFDDITSAAKFAEIASESIRDRNDLKHIEVIPMVTEEGEE